MMSWLAYITFWTAGLAGAVFAVTGDPRSRTLILLALGGVYVFAWACAIRCPHWGLLYPSLNRGPHDVGRVALTFTGGPHPLITPRLLELLGREKVPAAFFFTGRECEAEPHWVRQADEAGHQIARTVYRSRWSWSWMTDRGLRLELAQTGAVLSRILKRTPRFVRLPLARPGVPRLLQQMNLIGVGWDVGGEVIGAADPRAAAERIARIARNGSVIALYQDPDSGPDAALETASQTIVLLRDRGFTFARLDHLLEQAAYDESAEN